MEALAAHLAWVDPWLLPLWTVSGVAMSSLELLACVLSLAMVGFNLRVHPAGWPLAMISSVLYGLLFLRSRLYGEAALQVVFVVLAVWGWRQWLRGTSIDGVREPTPVRLLGRKGLWVACLGCLLMWPLMGALLAHATDSDVPYWDALPTTGSLIGQWLLGRKYVDNWPCWLLVNLVSMALFAHKGLWLTVWLYGLFAVLSCLGWRAWWLQAQASDAKKPASAANS